MSTLPEPAQLRQADSPESGRGSGDEMFELISTLFPIHRSTTGDGVRASLQHIKAWIPLDITEVPSGTPVFDWNVPDEWNLQDACIADEHGHRLVDFHTCNLHVVGGSVPVQQRIDVAGFEVARSNVAT